MTRTYTPPQIADGLLAGDFIRETEFALAFEIERLRAFEAAHKQLQAALDSAIRERDEARAEVERLHQAHQAACEGGDLLREEIEKLTRERDEARTVISTLEIVGKAADDERAQLRAEVERLIEWQSINHSEQHKLGWSMTEFCEGKRDHLHEMWERPPSLDYGIAHIEAEIKRLRAHNARLRAQIAEYFAEPTTHLVEDAE